MKCFTPRSRQPSECFRISGFTLIELLIAMMLSVFLLGGVILTYLSGRAAATETETLSRMQENIRFASDYLVRDVRNAGYRDHLTLTFNQYRLIGEEFARYGDGGDQSQLIIRYAGRGACGRVFDNEDELKVIENRYFVNADGELRCEGREIDENLNVSTPEPVTLAAGMSSITFDFILPTDANPVSTSVCDFYDNEVLDDACIGVRMLLEFEDIEPRVAQLHSAFRNVIVDRLYRRN